MKTEGHWEGWDCFLCSTQHHNSPSCWSVLFVWVSGSNHWRGKNLREHPLKTGKSLGEPSTEGCISKSGVEKNANAQFISLRFNPDHKCSLRIGSFFPHHCLDVNKERKWALRSFNSQFLGNWVTGSPKKHTRTLILQSMAPSHAVFQWERLPS